MAFFALDLRAGFDLAGVLSAMLLEPAAADTLAVAPETFALMRSSSAARSSFLPVDKPVVRQAYFCSVVSYSTLVPLQHVIVDEPITLDGIIHRHPARLPRALPFSAHPVNRPT